MWEKDLFVIDVNQKRHFIRWNAVAEINLDAKKRVHKLCQETNKNIPTIYENAVIITLLVSEGGGDAESQWSAGETITVVDEQADALRGYIERLAKESDSVVNLVNPDSLTTY